MSRRNLKSVDAVAQEQTVTVSREKLECWMRGIQSAQRAAICAAPRQVPWTWTGPQQAIAAFDSCEHVLRDMRQLIGGEQ